mgnify:CR=1 FL=1
MNERDKVRLHDIRDAAQRITAFIQGGNGSGIGGNSILRKLLLSCASFQVFRNLAPIHVFTTLGVDRVED